MRLRRSIRSKRADVYSLPETFVIHSRSETQSGYWVVAPPFLSVRKDAPASELVDALREALAASSSGLPDPTSSSEVMRPLLKHAGFRSARAFDRAGTHVAADATDDEVTFYPSYYTDRTDSRFTGETVVARLDSDQALSQALSSALRMSEIANEERRA